MTRASSLLLGGLVIAPLLVASLENVADVISQFIDDDNDEHRQLFGNLWNNDNQYPVTVGGRCGGGILNRNDNDDDTCQDGLECSPLALGRRCMPRQECIQSKLQDFNGDAILVDVMAEANVTEMDVWEARRNMLGDNEAFVHSQPVQALRTALQDRASDMSVLGDIVKDCMLPQDDDYDDESNSITVAHNGTDRHRQLQDDANPVVYLGLHLEAGALIDASFSSFWQLDGGLNFTDTTFLRACGGLEAGAGGELSLQVLVALTDNATTIDCLSILVDADAAPLLAVGAAAGFCVRDSSTVYFEFTLGSGVGGGLGVSVCEVFTVN